MAWEAGTPEREAAIRDMQGGGSPSDLHILMEQNLRDCLDALPADEKPPGFDAFHAGCCALRAYAYARRIARMRERVGRVEGGCPCLLVEPCHKHCSCRSPWMSRGCSRCCAYGSIEQRTVAAALLAERIERGTK